MNARNRKTKAPIVRVAELLIGDGNSELDPGGFDRNTDGSLSYEVCDTTLICWENAVPRERNGKAVFIDQNGTEVTEDEIELV